MNTTLLAHPLTTRALRGGLVSALALAAGLAGAGSASAQELRFEDTAPGNVVAIGNTLGLSNTDDVNGPGTCDSIGTFITLDANSSDGTFGANTTGDWTENGSTAMLSLPVEAEVLYAELVWGGSRNAGGVDVTSSLATPVTLRSGSAQVDVSPAAATSFNSVATVDVPADYYMRSADVTAFVQANGAGTYSVEGVPGTQNEFICALNSAGWTLVVAYRYDAEPVRNLTVFVGTDEFVDENATVDYEVSGFCAPPTGDVEGTIAISAVEGDSRYVGDSLAIAPTTADTFVRLSGPNNPVNNFFCSQINDGDGQLDTSGSFGTVNHDAQTGGVAGQVSGARQGWDVTTVRLSSDDDQLFPGQTEAVLRTQTTGDSYMPTLAALAIDVNAPTFTYDESTTTATPAPPAEVSAGDTITLSARILNEGSAAANDVDFTLEVPTGLSLQTFTTNGASGDIDGTPVLQGDLVTGVDMGDVGLNAERNVVLTLRVDALPSTDIVLRPIWNYSFQMCQGDPALTEQFKAPIVTVLVETPSTTSSSASSGAGGAGAGPSTGGSTGDGGGDDGAGGGAEAFAEGGGIFCSATPGAGTGSWITLAGLGALALAGLGRRRR